MLTYPSGKFTFYFESPWLIRIVFNVFFRPYFLIVMPSQMGKERYSCKYTFQFRLEELSATNSPRHPTKPRLLKSHDDDDAGMLHVLVLRLAQMPHIAGLERYTLYAATFLFFFSTPNQLLTNIFPPDKKSIHDIPADCRTSVMSQYISRPFPGIKAAMPLL